MMFEIKKISQKCNSEVLGLDDFMVQLRKSIHIPKYHKKIVHTGFVINTAKRARLTPDSPDLQWYALLGRHFNSIVLPADYHLEKFTKFSDDIFSGFCSKFKFEMC